MNPNFALRLSSGSLLTCGALCLTLNAHAAGTVSYKANNSDNLNLTTSWELGTVPTAGEIATWDAYITSANSTLLGANLSWEGIRVDAPAGPVTISGLQTLGLGVSGIDLSNAAQNLTINSAVSLTAAQSWNSAANRRVTVSGPVSGAFNLTKAGLGELVLDGSGSNSFESLTIDATGGGASGRGTLLLGKTGGASAVAAGKTIQFGTGAGEANLRMQQSNQFGSGVVMNFANASGQWCRMDLAGTSQTLAGLNAGALATQAGAVIQNRAIGDTSSLYPLATLTLNGSGSYLYNGYLRDSDNGVISSANQLRLVKEGSGTQTLAGSQISHSGGTIVNDGKLVLGAGGGTGSLRGAVTVNAPGTLDYAGDNSFGYNVGANVTSLTINNSTVGGANFGNHFYQNFALNMTGGTLLLGGGNNEFHNATIAVNASPVTSTIARTTGNTTALMRVRDGLPMTLDVADGTQPVDLSITAPLVTATAGSIVTKTGPGTLLLTGAQDNASTILAATGGTTILDKSGATIRAAAGISNIGAGATVRIAGTSGDQIYGGGSGNLGRVGMSGGTLDLAGLNEGWDRLEGTGIITNSAPTTSTVTLGENNGSGIFTGSINDGAGTVKLVKVGTGTLGLGGSNNLSGTVEVNAGTLALTGSIPASATTVADGAGVAGEGSFSSLRLGATTGSSLQANPATLGALGVTGGLEVKGTTTVNLANGLFTTGVPFKVINFGSKTGTWGASNFVLGNAASYRGTPVFSETANDVSLTLTGTTLKWNNAGGNLKWDTNISANFHDSSANSTFYWGDKVTFDDTPGASQVIAIDGTQQPASMTLNSQYDYTFNTGASGSLAGGMSLVKSGVGILTVNSSNSFLGSTTVNGGTLAIGADAALGTAPAAATPGHLAINGGTLRWTANFSPSGNRGIAIGANGATFNTVAAGNGNTVTLGSAITGSGPVTFQSHGELLDAGGAVGAVHLSNVANSFTGNVVITSGQLTIHSNFGDPANGIVLNGGGLVDQNLNINFPRNIQIGANGGSYRTYGSTSTSTLAGSVSNAPGVAATTFRRVDGGTALLAGDWSGFAGQFQNKRGNIRISAPNANWANVDYIQDAAGGWLEFRGGGNAIVNSVASTRDTYVNYGTTLNVDSGVISMATNGHWWQTNAGDLGKLTSSSGTLTLTNGAASGTLGTLDHQMRVKLVDFNGSTPLTFVKDGVNHLSVSQANTYSGGTLIKAGRVQADHFQALGTGLVTVQNGGQASLNSTAGAFTNNFSIAGPGQAEGAGTLGAIRFVNNTISGNVTVAPAGSRITAHGGTGTLTGALLGSGNLEINSTATNNNGTISLNGNSPSYTGALSLSQGRLNANGATFGGSLAIADGTTLGGEASFAGSVTLGSTTGSALVIDAATPAKLTAGGAMTVNGTVNVTLSGYPANSSPVEVVGFASKGGTWGPANFSFAAPTGARAISFSETANAIVLNVPTTDLVWNDAAATASWNTNVDANFKDASSVNQPFFWGDRVTFNDLPGTDQVIGVAGAVEPGLMTVNSKYNYEFFGDPIAGGGIVKSGIGTLTLSQANTLTGNITVNGGKLVGAGIRNGTSTAFGLGSTTRTITVNAGATLEFQRSNTFGNHNTTVVPALVVNGGTVTNSNAQTPDLNNALNQVVLNNGTLTSTVGSSSPLDAPRSAETYGSWNLNGTVTSTGLSIITTTAPANGQVMLGSVGSDTTFAVSDGTLTVSAPLMSGDATYKSGLVKTQPGTMVLTTASIYTGPTTVNGGTLLANNASGSGTGTGAITVNATGKLGGTGAVAGAVTVNTGGTLAPGASIESLATGALNLATGSSFAVEYNSSGAPAVDVVNVTGNVTLAGSLNLTDLAAVPAALTLGTKLTIVTYTGTLTGTFDGVLEGGIVTSGPNNFKVRYADGNAVTLEATNEVSNPYTGWASSKGLTGADALADADPDKDGIANLVEFVLGGEPNPANPNSNSSSLLPTISVNATQLIFTFRRTDASATLDPFVEYGTALNAWTEAQAGVNGVTVAEDNDFYGSSTDRVTVRIPRSLATPGSKLFARLKVTE